VGTPLQVLLFAERCAALSGSDTDFMMIVIRRSNYRSRIVRPAADGWYPKRGLRASKRVRLKGADGESPV